MKIYKKNNSTMMVAVVLMVITLVTQLASLYKSSLMASYFGTGYEISAFNFINNICSCIFSLVGVAIATVVIPSLVRKENKSVSIFLNYLYLLCLFFVILFIYFDRHIITYLSNKTDVNFINYSHSIIGMLLISNLILSLYNFLVSVFQVNGSYNSAKLIQLISTALIICSFFVLKNINVFKFVMVVSFSNMLNVLLLFFFRNYARFGYVFSLDYKDIGFQKMLFNIWPLFLSTGIFQISILIDNIIVMKLRAESITIFSYSIQIIAMLYSLFIGNLISIFYPKISAYLHVEKEIFKRQLKVESLIFCVFALSLMISVLFIIVAEDVIKILFVHGHFTQADAEQMFWMCVILALGLPFNALRDIIYRVFYAHENTMVTFYNSLIATFSNVLLTLLASYYLGIVGVLIGTSISMAISCLRISLKLKLLNYSIIRKSHSYLYLLIISVTVIIVCFSWGNISMGYFNTIVKLIIAVAIYLTSYYKLLYKNILMKEV